jgi:3-hydroxymyristoyl/3-hydroxydecanoyl-(acyl carrier protein) dehydratase
MMTNDELLDVMPHRGRNVLIDEFEDDGEVGGRATLTITEDDEEGRDIFLVREGGQLRYSPYFLVEHAALNSVMILREDMGGGRLAYFSAVTKFQRHDSAMAGETIVSKVTRGRDRREFRSFHADLATSDGRAILEVNFMAYLAARGDRPEATATARAPDRFCRPAPGLFPGFHPKMVFCGSEDDEGRSGGVYPHDHPLCEGHFPDAPVMMGMSQWLTVAQRGALLAPVGDTEIFGDGAITKVDGTPVVDVTGLKAQVVKDEENRIAWIRLNETRKVAFRGMIHPGDAYTVTFEPVESD